MPEPVVRQLRFGAPSHVPGRQADRPVRLLEQGKQRLNSRQHDPRSRRERTSQSLKVGRRHPLKRGLSIRRQPVRGDDLREIARSVRPPTEIPSVAASMPKASLNAPFIADRPAPWLRMSVISMSNRMIRAMRPESTGPAGTLELRCSGGHWRQQSAHGDRRGARGGDHRHGRRGARSDGVRADARKADGRWLRARRKVAGGGDGAFPARAHREVGMGASTRRQACRGPRCRSPRG